MQPPPRPDQPTGRHFWHTETTSADPAAVWALWTDVPNWGHWDDGLTSASLEGPFQPGAKGKILADGRTSHFQVLAVEEGKAYTFRTAFPLGGLNIRRSLSPKENKWEITHEVWFDGISKSLFGFILGRKWLTMLPAVVRKVKTLAEQ